MPLKTDGKRRWVEIETLVPGTPEQVWHAVATGPGIGAWFVRTQVDERVGGAIAFDFGDGNGSTGTITAWEPPFRLAYEERDWSKDAPPVATELVITSRSGDRCVVRMVHSLFTTQDSWDDELEGFEAGWPGFLAVLRFYLGKFAGQPAAGVHAAAPCAVGEPEAWSRLTAALALQGSNVGERRQAPAGAPRLAGTVERIRQDRSSREMMLALAEPAPGVALLGTYSRNQQAHAGVSLYLYGAGAADTAAAVAGEWSAWLKRTLESPPPAR